MIIIHSINYLLLSIFLFNIKIASRASTFFIEALQSYSTNSQCQDTTVNSIFWHVYYISDNTLNTNQNCYYQCFYSAYSNTTTGPYYRYLYFTDPFYIELPIASIPTSYNVIIQIYLANTLSPTWGGSDLLSVTLDGTEIYNEQFSTINGFSNCYYADTNSIDKTFQYHLISYSFNAATLADPNNFIIRIQPTLQTGLYYGLAGVNISYSACDSSCKLCSGPLFTDCTACTSSYYLNNSKCISACPSNYYFTNDVPRSCARCLALNCDQCTPSNSTNCTLCHFPYYINLLNNLCVTQCPINYYNNSIVCTICDVSCINCMYPGTSSFCTQCVTSNTYYLTGSPGQCLACNSACVNCSSSGTAECYSCNSGYYLYGTTCNPSCPSGYFPTSADKLCNGFSTTTSFTYILNQPFRQYFSNQQCQSAVITDPFWQLFNMSSNNASLLTYNCLYNCYIYPNNDDTYFGYLLFPTKLYAVMNFSNFPAAYQIKIEYYLLKTLNPTWSPLDSIKVIIDNVTYAILQSETFSTSDGFKNCYTANTNIVDQIIYHKYHQHIISTSLLKNPFLFKITFLPVTQTIGLNFGIGGFAISYLACESTCQKCKGPLATDCTSCDDSHFLSNLSTCPTVCPATYWGDIVKRMCFPCTAQNCDNCSTANSTFCYQCTINFYLNHANLSCINPCPIGQYGSVVTQNCTICNITCVQCVNPGTGSFCTSCNPVGYYLTANPGQCIACNSNCYNCSGASNSQCNYCTNGNYMQTGNTCLPTCPNGQWGTNLNNTCLTCHSYCEICQDETTTKCSQCNAGAFKVSGQTICTTICPDGYYGNQGTKTCNECQGSQQTCATCTAINTCTSCAINAYLSGSNCILCNSLCGSCFGSASTQCNICSTGNFMLGTTCYASCPFGYYNNPNFFCTLCDTTCNGCSGQGNTNCLSCVNGFYLSVTTCNPCDISCSNCTGQAYTQCSACSSGYFLNETTCSNTCPSNKYPESSIKLCLFCNPSCFTCNGGTSSNCLSCLTNQYLLSGQCLSCDISCATCLSSSVNCLSCSIGYYSYINNQCLLFCPAGFYSRNQTMSCANCNQRCTTCNGQFSNNCLSCTIPYVFNATTSTCLSCSDYIGLYSDPNNFTNCLEICGDGIKVISSSQCDDGNLINGDGCSSNCLIESNYNCSGSSIITKDICYPLKIIFTTKLLNDQSNYLNIDKNSPIQMLLSFFPAPIFPSGTSLIDYINIQVTSLSKAQFSYTLQQNINNPKQYFLNIDVSSTLKNQQVKINFIQTQNFTSNLQTSNQEGTQSVEIKLFVYYSDNDRNSAQTYATLTKFLVIVYIAMLVYSLISSNFFVAGFGIQSLQFTYLLKFAGLRYQISVVQILEQMSNSFNFFLPSLTESLVYYNQTTYTSYLANGIDAIYLKNAGQLFVLFCSTTFIYGTCKILAQKEFWDFLRIENKTIQRIFQRVVLAVIEYGFLINILELTLPIQMFYSAIQLTNGGTDIILKLVLENKNNIYIEDNCLPFEDRVVNSLFSYRSLFVYLNKSSEKAFIYPIFNIIRKILLPVAIVAGHYYNYVQFALCQTFSLVSLYLILKEKCITSTHKFKIYLALTEIINFATICPFYLMVLDDDQNDALKNVGTLIFTVISILNISFQITYFFIYQIRKNLINQVNADDENIQHINQDEKYQPNIQQSVKSSSQIPLSNLGKITDQIESNEQESQHLNKFHLKKKKVLRRSQFQAVEKNNHLHSSQDDDEVGNQPSLSNFQQSQLVNKTDRKLIQIKSNNQTNQNEEVIVN